MNLVKRLMSASALAAAIVAGINPGACALGGTIVRFETVEGSFDVQLYNGAMPRSVANFLHYVNSGKYNDTVVHRNSDTRDTATSPLRDFVIQGGGYKITDPVGAATTISVTNVQTVAPILDEPGGGVAGPSNVVGTIAFAKSGPNTVTSQWFINQGNNSVLDNPARTEGGFSAFGRVLGPGMTVVNKIGDLSLARDTLTATEDAKLPSAFGDLPVRNFTGTTYASLRKANTVTVNTVRVLNVAAGDFDRNGVVDAADLSILTTNFGQASGAFFDKGDANMDGKVNGSDYLLWQRTRGATTTLAGAVPEPSAATLTILAAGAVGAGRRLRARGAR